MSPQIVWGIVTNDVPVLLAEVRSLMTEIWSLTLSQYSMFFIVINKALQAKGSRKLSYGSTHPLVEKIHLAPALVTNKQVSLPVVRDPRGFGLFTHIDPAKLFRRSLSLGIGSRFDQVFLFHAVVSFNLRVPEALLHDLPGKILIHRVLLTHHIRAFRVISG